MSVALHPEGASQAPQHFRSSETHVWCSLCPPVLSALSFLLIPARTRQYIHSHLTHSLTSQHSLLHSLTYLQTNFYQACNVAIDLGPACLSVSFARTSPVAVHNGDHEQTAGRHSDANDADADLCPPPPWGQFLLVRCPHHRVQQHDPWSWRLHRHLHGPLRRHGQLHHLQSAPAHLR